MAADTSSAAATVMLVIEGVAAACAALSVDPIPAISAAAADNSSGMAITYDMRHPLITDLLRND
jgi:hypothetical protein